MKNDNLYYKWSTRIRLSKVNLLELKPCCIFVWIVSALQILWFNIALSSRQYDVHGVKGDKGKISCAIGEPRVHTVWFGFSGKKQMPRCDELLQTEDDCLINLQYEDVGSCNPQGVSKRRAQSIFEKKLLTFFIVGLFLSKNQHFWDRVSTNALWTFLDSLLLLPRRWTANGAIFSGWCLQPLLW